MKQGRRFLLLAGLAAIAFLLFLGRPEIVASHEARVAQPARVMAASGWPWSATPVDVPPVVLRPGIVRLMPDWSAQAVSVNPWLVPVLNGQVRLQKPPLPYWCSAVLFRLFGFSEFANRFFPALMGVLSTFLLFDLGKRLFGVRTAWCAALVWVSTYSVPEMYRKAMADPYLAFFTLACVWAWTGVSEECSLRQAQAREVKSEEITRQKAGDGEKRSKSGPQKIAPSPRESPTPHVSLITPHSSLFTLHSALFTLLFHLSLAFALLAKGPPALLNVLIPLAAFHACTRRRPPGRLWVHVAGVLMVLAIALPWPVYVWRNVPHAMDLWRYESVGELTDNTENARAWWFYLPQLFYLSLPWTPLWIAGCAIPFVKYSRRGRASLAAKLLTSASPSRTETVRSADPAGAVAHDIAATDATDLPTTNSLSDRREFFPLIWWGVTVLFFSLVHLKKSTYLLPAMPAVALMTGLAMGTVLAWARRLRFKALPGTFIALQAIIGIGFALAVGGLLFWGLHEPVRAVMVGSLALGCALLPLPFMFNRRPMGWLMAQASAYTVIILLFTHFYLAPIDNSRSAKHAAQVMTALCSDPAYTILIPHIPEEVAVYLPANAKYGFGHKVLVIVDDTRGVRERGIRHLPLTDPTVESFTGWVFDASIVKIQRISVPDEPADSRWKIYELTVTRQAFASVAH